MLGKMDRGLESQGRPFLPSQGWLLPGLSAMLYIACCIYTSCTASRESVLSGAVCIMYTYKCLPAALDPTWSDTSLTQPVKIGVQSLSPHHMMHLPPWWPQLKVLAFWVACVSLRHTKLGRGGWTKGQGPRKGLFFPSQVRGWQLLNFVLCVWV